MSKVLRFPLWFLLVPYFAVRSLNVRPWFKGQRETANRTNGAIVVAFIATLIVTGALYAAGNRQLPYNRTFAIASYLLALVATLVFLNRERERHYSAAYSSMPWWKRSAFATGTIALVVLSFWAVPIKVRHASTSQPKELTCNKAASEVTAESCSTD
jgi:quinol-cytochrome oxidoreductase complex cytochrome b subunit